MRRWLSLLVIFSLFAVGWLPTVVRSASAPVTAAAAASCGHHGGDHAGDHARACQCPSQQTPAADHGGHDQGCCAVHCLGPLSTGGDSAAAEWRLVREYARVPSVVLSSIAILPSLQPPRA